jgi:hypothetical protein
LHFLAGGLKNIAAAQRLTPMSGALYSHDIHSSLFCFDLDFFSSHLD